MEHSKAKPVTMTNTSCHVVAMPYPGRGHINPMINLCKHILSQKPDILFTFVVTEEWLSFLSPYKMPTNIRFQTIPNVIPSELGRANDFPGFLEAVATKMKVPFLQLLDGLDFSVDAIIYDTYLDWVVKVGNSRNIPVASLFTMSATVFSVFHHFDLLVQNDHFPLELSEQGEEVVDYIPGVPPARLLDLPTVFNGTGRQVLSRALEPVSMVSKAQYLLFTSAYELEAGVIDALKLKFPFPVYTLGPSIPYVELKDNSGLSTNDHNIPDYLEWLNSQPKGSVFYVSMGSFLSVSSAQKEEIVAGVCNSGVRFLWVSRGETTLFKDGYGNMGLVVSWCDQLGVLSHPSVGGFMTHCGWNSTMEGVFSGIPMLAFPIFWDQIPNSKKIVEDWNVGWRVKPGVDHESLVTREEIAELVKNLMDQESDEVKTMRRKAKELQEACRAAIARGGSSHSNLASFIRDISQGKAK
ncbi:UDP-glycosyltransferase 87A2 [Ricinus communis]|uniref:Glycosyltransferase n=1 Tax=Ricinus communis TaxID=3988 RepID=B9SRZ9_RICCO|nr:UDP-glycosyltransferase 87A2 [Ricinus communis]EEF33590.1 UDP-glucosyltransferase, putative [Ricinus communis]